MSSCQFNLFAAFDKIEIPSAAELSYQATTDPEGLVDDVQEFVDSGSIDEDNADDVVAALKTVYTAQPATEIGQKAAILAGAISIDSDPEAKDAVNGIVSVALSGTTDLTAIKALFPTDRAEFDALLANMAAAEDAYISFINQLDVAPVYGVVDTDPAVTLDNVEKGDIAQYAIVSIVITQIAFIAGPDNLFAFVADPSATGITAYDPVDDDPFDFGASVLALAAYINFAGIVF